VSTNDNILNIGPVSTTVSCSVGLQVQEQGCSTGHISGQILGCFGMVQTVDKCLGTLPYIEQIVVANNSPNAFGDSGSLLVSAGPNPQAVGLHFASDPGGMTGYANWIGNVLQLLGMSGTAAPVGASSALAAEAPMPSTGIDALDQEAGHTIALFGPDLMKIPGVWGVEDHLEPDGTIAIRVDVEQITPEIESAVPQTLGTFPVEIHVGPMPVEDSLGEQPVLFGRRGKQRPKPAPHEDQTRA
jgi:hypothetical protein